MSAGQIKIVTAMRVTVLANAQGMGVKCYLSKQMPNEDAALHFAHIVETMCEVWPEPVRVQRPCCGQVSYDEMLLLDLMTAVVRAEPAAFQNLICDMVGERDRNRLLAAMTKFTLTCQGHEHQK